MAEVPAARQVRHADRPYHFHPRVFGAKKQRGGGKMQGARLTRGTSLAIWSNDGLDGRWGTSRS